MIDIYNMEYITNKMAQLDNAALANFAIDFRSNSYIDRIFDDREALEAMIIEIVQEDDCTDKHMEFFFKMPTPADWENYFKKLARQ